MSNRFAAGTGDTGRRRRRLASTGDGAAPEATPSESTSGSSQGPGRRFFRRHGPVVPTHSESPPLPLATLIPRHPLWYLLLAGLLTGGVVGLHLAALRTDLWKTELSPGLSRLVDPRLGVVGGGATALLCLASAQVLLLVGWTRAHSARDYAGRYRKWFGLSAQLGALGLVLGVQGYRSLGQAAPQLLPDTLWKRDVLVWLAPLVTWLLVATVSASLELRRAPGPLLCLILSTLASLAAGGLALQLFDPGSAADQLTWQQTLFLASGAAGFLSACLTLRHVLYVSLDPPVRLRATGEIPEPHFEVEATADTSGKRKATSGRRRASGKKRTKTRRPRRRAAETTDVDESDDAPASDDGWPDDEAVSPEDEADDSLDEPDDDDADVEDEPEIAPPAKSNSPPTSWGQGASSSAGPKPSPPGGSPQRTGDSATTAAGDDEDHDQDELEEEDPESDSLRGLSKKERRRLRQQQRERERQTGRR